MPTQFPKPYPIKPIGKVLRNHLNTKIVRKNVVGKINNTKMISRTKKV